MVWESAEVWWLNLSGRECLTAQCNVELWLGKTAGENFMLSSCEMKSPKLGMQTSLIAENIHCMYGQLINEWEVRHATRIKNHLKKFGLKIIWISVVSS